jgi:hypothetical protein
MEAYDAALTEELNILRDSRIRDVYSEAAMQQRIMEMHAEGIRHMAQSVRLMLYLTYTDAARA